MEGTLVGVTPAHSDPVIRRLPGIEASVDLAFAKTKDPGT
jgi:hypothetical protein